MESHLFADSRKRLDRAVFHAEAVKAEWEHMVDEKSYETIMEVNSDWTEVVARYVRSSPVPENNLAIGLGEMFYQLRAALDHLIYKASVIAEGVEPPSNENRVEFPICIDPDRFKTNTVNKGPFPRQLRDWIEEIQPYNAAKHAGTDMEVHVRALRVLHDCARKDRHRRLHVVAAAPTEYTHDIFAWPGRVLSAHPLRTNLLEGKDEFLRITVTGFDPKGDGGQIKLNSDVLIEISIDEIPVAKPGDSAAAFNAIFEVANMVIMHFEEWFERFARQPFPV